MFHPGDESSKELIYTLCKQKSLICESKETSYLLKYEVQNRTIEILNFVFFFFNFFLDKMESEERVEGAARGSPSSKAKITIANDITSLRKLSLFLKTPAPPPPPPPFPTAES